MQQLEFIDKVGNFEQHTNMINLPLTAFDMGGYSIYISIKIPTICWKYLQLRLVALSGLKLCMWRDNQCHGIFQ